MPVKPSQNEEEYFARLEFEKIKKAQEANAEKMNKEEKKKLQELHYMHCPKCGHNLVEIDHKGVAVDKCSHCDGIWLDAGEMEQISKLEKKILDKLFIVFRR